MITETATPIYLSQDDHLVLRLYLSAAPRSALTTALKAELDRASVLPREQMPAGVVGLNTAVCFEDLATGVQESYRLVLPHRANIEAGLISVLSPVGTALLGYRVGDVVEWPTPGGRRQLRVASVEGAVA